MVPQIAEEKGIDGAKDIRNLPHLNFQAFRGISFSQSFQQRNQVLFPGGQ